MSNDAPLRIVQIAPRIEPGSGVAGVAYELERALSAAGARVERFTLAQARGHARPPRTRIGHVWEVLWFTISGTRRARAFLRARPDAVSICHNDAMLGDVYVNHGLLQASMRARGNYLWRMVRNPLHLFTTGRDRIRYRGGRHRLVIALTEGEARLLRATYGSVHAPIEVIPNGVDVDRFRPPLPAERTRARREWRIPDDDWVAVFVGHEFDRKGLPLILQALPQADGVHLLVVGGTTEMIRDARADAARRGVGDRVVFAGRQSDVLPALWAADALVLPSAYEANALVVLEALACGIPVVATAVGAAPDLIVDGRNGYVIDRDVAPLAEALRRVRDAGHGAFAQECRETAVELSWDRIAERYLRALARVRRERTDGRATP